MQNRVAGDVEWRSWTCRIVQLKMQNRLTKDIKKEQLTNALVAALFCLTVIDESPDPITYVKYRDIKMKNT